MIFTTNRLDVLSLLVLRHVLLLAPLLLLLGATQHRDCTAALRATTQQHERRIHSPRSHTEPLVDLGTPQHRKKEPATLCRPRGTLEQEMRQILRAISIAERALVLPLRVHQLCASQTVVC
jgi:hypothetical protein